MEIDSSWVAIGAAVVSVVISGVAVRFAKKSADAAEDSSATARAMAEMERDRRRARIEVLDWTWTEPTIVDQLTTGSAPSGLPTGAGTLSGLWSGGPTGSMGKLRVQNQGEGKAFGVLASVWDERQSDSKARRESERCDFLESGDSVELEVIARAFYLPGWFGDGPEKQTKNSYLQCKLSWGDVTGTHETDWIEIYAPQVRPFG